MIDLSLNEVESLAAKVGRGAGYPWGLADDISRAARVLAASGLPWAEALHKLADRCAGFGPSGPLCPVLTAARINDEPGAETVRFDNVALPVWLAAGLATRPRDAELSVSWPSGGFWVGDGLIVARCDGAACDSADVAITTCEISEAPAPLRRAQADEALLAKLGLIAERVYVPASELSRARGAGGGSVDDE